MNKRRFLDFLNFYISASVNAKLSNTVSYSNNSSKKMV